MRKIVSGLMAAALSAATLAASLVPAQAAGMPRADVTVQSDVENVDYYVRRGYRPPPPHYGGSRYYRSGYYRGYRGYPYYREGYRRYDDGYWYPLAAFGAEGGDGSAPPSFRSRYIIVSTGTEPFP